MVVTRTSDERINFVLGVSKELWLADVLMEFLNLDNMHLEVLSCLQRSVKRVARIELNNNLYELEADFVAIISVEGIFVYMIMPMAVTNWKGNLNKIVSLIPENLVKWLI